MAAMMPGPGAGPGGENPYNYDTPVDDDLIDPDDGTQRLKKLQHKRSSNAT